jgi:hypothetical protein
MRVGVAVGVRVVVGVLESIGGPGDAISGTGVDNGESGGVGSGESGGVGRGESSDTASPTGDVAPSGAAAAGSDAGSEPGSAEEKGTSAGLAVHVGVVRFPRGG